ncbi:Phosphate import ATP-binding protein PstB 3 [Sinobacterium norvegicum]|uniref:Phosphate import ATP-binding protein PstB 3 n=1 Tax=Sinobacterium norvegicum TaxID=1641715 RepID=A0ABN8EF52_9GAMM|nr:Phosphate import ATP-binding protein PstB 3 [Sinobacterium norvegicum]
MNSTNVKMPELAMNCHIKSIHYGDFLAVRDSELPIEKGKITGLIGPSGCGKSTVLRSLNRMNDMVQGFNFEGSIEFMGIDLYEKKIDPVLVRRYIGMVFQQPNPFAMSIYDNVAFGLRLNGFKGNKSDLDQRVEKALRRAALWDSVKDKLQKSGLSLSGGQQQRLCIARAIATEPSVLLMDEPCSALDPIATRKIEALMLELRERFSIVIVTHNMQQAKRIADNTAFFSVDMSGDSHTGHLVEMGKTEQIFENPKHEMTRHYIAGEFS